VFLSLIVIVLFFGAACWLASAAFAVVGSGLTIPSYCFGRFIGE
jgi:hypothetical protein